MNRLCDILKQEHIEYDKKVIAELIQRHYQTLEEPLMNYKDIQ